MARDHRARAGAQAADRVHIFYLADAKAALAAGADFIAHSVRDVPVDAEFISEMKARDACYSPTLMREVSTFVYGATPPWATIRSSSRAWAGHPGADEGSRAARADAGSNAWKAGPAIQGGPRGREANLKTLADQGVRIAMGTDTGPPARFQGFFEHLELEMMVDAGLTPMQVLVSATGDAARCTARPARSARLRPAPPRIC